MPINKGVLTSSRSNDDLYTPFYAVDPILKYLPKTSKIWTPCDESWSAFPRKLREEGFDVVRTSLAEGKDFFTYEPPEWDVVVTNPPFSIKDNILERLYQLGKPFAVLLPLNSLQGKSRYEFFKQGIQILAFDSRICYHNPENMEKPVKGSPFATAYFCRDLLPQDLIVKHLEEYERPLKEA